MIGQIQRTLRILVRAVDRGRQKSRQKRLHRGSRSQGRRRRKGVADHALDGTDPDLPENRIQDFGLHQVIGNSPRPVGIHRTHLIGGELRPVQRTADSVGKTRTRRIRSGNVGRIAAGPVARDFGKNGRAPLPGVFQFL